MTGRVGSGRVGSGQVSRFSSITVRPVKSLKCSGGGKARGVGEPTDRLWQLAGGMVYVVFW